eukprot:235298_1
MSMMSGKRKNPIATHMDEAYALYMKMHDNKAPTASRFKLFVNSNKRCQMTGIDYVTADRYLSKKGRRRTRPEESLAHLAEFASLPYVPRWRRPKRKSTLSSTTGASSSKQVKKNQHNLPLDFALSNLFEDVLDLFVEHMTDREAQHLGKMDTLDHRCSNGLYLTAKVVQKSGTKYKIRYKHNKNDVWSDYRCELYRFARHHSITRRPPHRMFNIMIGEGVDVNPMKKGKRLGWREGVLVEKDCNSGQVKVQYTSKKGRKYHHWAHLDNVKEISPHTSMAGTFVPLHPFVPLHRFTPQILCYHIKTWVLGDANYQNNLLQTKLKFKQRKLHGRMIHAQPMKNTKDMMEKDLLLSSCVTPKTFDIIMAFCEQWKEENSDYLESRSTKQIAHILLRHPLDRLLQRIVNEDIDGKRFIESVIAFDEDIISEETGWDEQEVYQIQSMLFRHHTFTKSQFEQNMNHVLDKQYATTLSEDIRDMIKQVMSQHNIEDIHYNIKHALSIDVFADSVMNMVDEWTVWAQNDCKESSKSNEEKELIVMQIYHAIAQCFVFDSIHDVLLALQHWVCNNCGNCNVNSYVNSSFTTNVPVCILCGMSQIDQIILKLRHHECYTMVNDVNITHCAIDSKESKSDDESIDKLIEEAINNDGLFNLLCPNKHHKHPCVSTLRLANKLIQYKRWLHTIYKEKGSDCIGETVKVDIAKIMDPNIFKNTFMQCIKDIESITDDNLRSITQLMQRNIQNIFDINMFVNSNQNNQKTFSETLRKYTKISDASCSNLYRVISKAIQAIAKTTPVDHNVLKETFLEQAALIHKQTELLTQMFEYNTDNIADIRLFAKIKPLAFGKLIRENTAIRVPTGVKLYRSIKEPLKQRAQREQFGQFLSDLDIVTIHKDYHHILDVHINHGNKETMKYVFRFFNLLVHYR